MTRLLAIVVAATIFLCSSPSQAAFLDLGTVLSLSATCTTTYQGGTAQLSGDKQRMTAVVTITKAPAGSAMAAAEFTVQVYDGTNWHDVGSTRNSTTLDTKTEHTVTAPAAGATTRVVLQTESQSPARAWRIAGKVTGGACVSGDVISAKAYVQ